MLVEQTMLTIAGLVAMAILSTGLVWVGSDKLERATDRLAAYYGLPAIVQGAILAGIGSSMPELLTAVLAPLIHGDMELGLSAIVGSAIFNILVIPAVAALAAGGSLQVSRDIVHKESLFYLVSVAVFLLTLSLAVVYYPTGASDLGGRLTPTLVLLPIGLYALYAFLQVQAVSEHQPTREITGIVPRREWVVFLGGFVLILLGVEGLLRSAIGFGDVFGTPSFIWGVTVIAAATSIPDLFVSVRAASADRDVASVANVFGSNVFDLLVAVPAGVLAVGGVVINFGQLAPLLAVLVIATVALFLALRTAFVLSRAESYALLGLYGGFLLWIALGVIGILPGPT